MSTSLIEECHRRAREARRSAEAASMPSRKASFLEMECLTAGTLWPANQERP